MKLFRLLILVLCVAILAGALVTYAWWRNFRVMLPIEWWSWFGLLLVVCGLTLVNILVRWVKWRYLCRRHGLRIPARRGLGVFLSTLPAMLTPFYVGELIRLPLMGIPVRHGIARMMRIFLLERGADVLVLASFVFAGSPLWFFVLLAGGWLLPLTFGRFYQSGWGSIVPLAFVAWCLPVAALYILVQSSTGTGSFGTMASVFGQGTLFGGLSGIPLGVGITGTSILQGLLDLGVSEQSALWIVSVFRLGTSWFALGLGGIALLGLVVWIKKNNSAKNHFDSIADQYVEEIPEHIRRHLLRRKVEAIVNTMGGVDGKAGLDVGCGQGEYSLQFALQGAEMTGVDLSDSQLVWARRNADSKDLEVEWVEASADQLPFPDGQFDFVYCVNMLHHMDNPDAQVRALGEMGRVLRPGGKIFVHEMNPLNPLFRFYMGYLFPVLNAIDEGTEWWVNPLRLPEVAQGVWLERKLYFTFLPDFVPHYIWSVFRPLESWLERSCVQRNSAHFMAIWEKGND